MQNKKIILIVSGVILILLIFILGAFLLTRDEPEPIDFDNGEERVEKEEDIEETRDAEIENDFDNEEREDTEDIDTEDEEEIDREADNGEEDELNDGREEVVEFEAVTHRGTGEDIIGIEKKDERMIAFYIKGNNEGKLFSIIGVSDMWRPTNLLVNTARPYEGVVLDSSGKMDMLEIKADGEWEIRYYPIELTRKTAVPGEIKGDGDDVIQIEGNAREMQVIGNPEGEHSPKQFNVNGYSPEKHRLVETTNRYNEKINLPENIFLLEIRGEGEWEIFLE